MPLSISKLQKLLTDRELQINNLFVLDGYLFYVELLSLKSSDTFFLYIPSKYDINVEKNDHYKMKYIDISNSENIADEYGENKEDDNLNILVSTGKENIEEHLKNNYKKSIPIGEISEEDTKELKAIHRQIKRLKNCVENINYKICIPYKNYICSIRRDNSIDFFTVKNFPRKNSKKLFIVIDLETLYGKNEEILKDLQTVKQSIYRVLEKNQNNHTYLLDTLMNSKGEIYNIPERQETHKIKYDSLLRELELMLNIMNKAEEKETNKLKTLNEEKVDGLQNDISRVHRKSQIEKELMKIENIKNEIVKNINITREKRENTILNIDNILFDNTVMFDSMIKNFNKLRDFC